MQNPPQQQSQPVAAKKVIFVLVVVLVAGVLGVISWSNAVTHPQNISVVNGSVDVSAGATQSFTFSVPQGAMTARVSGSFSVSTGSGSDIKVYVYDSYGTVLYSSGQVPVGVLDVPLPSGPYSLVFDNTFSTASAKTVQAQATLSYIPPP